MNTIGLCLGLYRLQFDFLNLTRGHDELAKAARCHTVFLAEGVELLLSFHAETRFQTVGRVIDPGMNNF